jgi:hypothetical protein
LCTNTSVTVPASVTAPVESARTDSLDSASSAFTVSGVDHTRAPLASYRATDDTPGGSKKNPASTNAPEPSASTLAPPARIVCSRVPERSYRRLTGVGTAYGLAFSAVEPVTVIRPTASRSRSAGDSWLPAVSVQRASQTTFPAGS